MRWMSGVVDVPYNTWYVGCLEWWISHDQQDCASTCMLLMQGLCEHFARLCEDYKRTLKGLCNLYIVDFARIK